VKTLCSLLALFLVLAIQPSALRADRESEASDWWSLRPIRSPPLPEIATEDAAWVRTPIDAFIVAKQRENGLRPSREADRRTLIRRLYFDLVGLPPAPEAVEAFVHDDRPLAYEELVEELLASPGYGERWARHWLDVAHYADTHGYDKDKLRPNAWPYRDYVIRAFNEDRDYTRFVREQVAGDVLYPDTPDGIEAMGLISSGPWDFIGHVEVPETKLDGQVARNLDRDDMVSTTLNVFCSITVQCARCHDHKFDPVKQEHYYSLQAVFASLDRAERRYDRDPAVAARRWDLSRSREQFHEEVYRLRDTILEGKNQKLEALDAQIAQLRAAPPFPQPVAVGEHPAAHGFRSLPQAESSPERFFIRLYLGDKDVELEEVLLFPAAAEGQDDFGFPRRFRIEIADNSDFKESQVLFDHTAEDFPRPGPWAVSIPGRGLKAKFLRVVPTLLHEEPRRAGAPRRFVFAMGEVAVVAGGNVLTLRNAATNGNLPARPGWENDFLVDGVFGKVRFEGLGGPKGDPVPAKLLRPYVAPAWFPGDVARLEKLHWQALEETAPAETEEFREASAQLTALGEELASLPEQDVVYVGTVHQGRGKFLGRYGLGPREIRVLNRGDLTNPGKVVEPGAPPLLPGRDWRFDLPEGHDEGARRVALADWLVSDKHPLTWRSIVNRVWQYHFGRGIVESPNDFGRMGELPTHPQLLEWLAAEFRARGSRGMDQSIKNLQRLMVTSSVYRQSSASDAEGAALDGSNRFLWRMQRRKLEAEAIRDTTLLAAGLLNAKMYGPGFRDFVLEKPQHSPHYEYHKHDPEDRSTHRRAVYRFLARSQQEPFMETLDCADPSQRVARRNETQTSLQALALMNNKFMLAMAAHFAKRLEREAASLPEQIQQAYAFTLGRPATEQEEAEMVAYAQEFDLANACRVIFNLNEYVFVD